jgi:dimethylaniline monooxygenase (N-oxide forming)
VIGAGSSGIAAVKALRERMRRRYVASPRHTMEVDFDDYLFALRRELKAGGRRAREAGFRLPVAPSGGARAQQGTVSGTANV